MSNEISIDNISAKTLDENGNTLYECHTEQFLWTFFRTTHLDPSELMASCVRYVNQDNYGFIIERPPEKKLLSIIYPDLNQKNYTIPLPWRLYYISSRSHFINCRYAVSPHSIYAEENPLYACDLSILDAMTQKIPPIKKFLSPLPKTTRYTSKFSSFILMYDRYIMRTREYVECPEFPTPESLDTYLKDLESRSLIDTLYAERSISELPTFKDMMNHAEIGSKNIQTYDSVYSYIESLIIQTATQYPFDPSHAPSFDEPEPMEEMPEPMEEMSEGEEPQLDYPPPAPEDDTTASTTTDALYFPITATTGTHINVTFTNSISNTDPSS